MFGLDKNKNAEGVITCSFPFVKPKAKKEMDGQVRCQLCTSGGKSRRRLHNG